MYFIAALFYISCINLFSQYVAPVRTMYVPYAHETMVMDGVASESSWNNAQETTVFMTDGWDNAADLSGYFKLAWDSSFLYLYTSITDDIDHSMPSIYDSWMFDCIEIYIDLDTNSLTTTYSSSTAELRFNRGTGGVSSVGRAQQTDFLYYWENTATGWIAELAIPWIAALPIGSSPEDIMTYITESIGFDLSFLDSDNSDGDIYTGNRDAMTAWDRDYPDDPSDRTEFNAWNNTNLFGIVTLISDTATIPLADPGYDLSVCEDSVVTLNGTGSADPQGAVLNFTWTAPDDIILSDVNSATPNFIAPDVDGETTFVFSLVVDNGTLSSSAEEVLVTVLDMDILPIANAGADQLVYTDSIVFLDGSASYDPSGFDISYTWIAPEGITLSDVNSPTPWFTAPSVADDTSFIFRLDVSNGFVWSETDTVFITVKPEPIIPVADAGPDQYVDENTLVTLDASGSYDPEGGDLEYHWVITLGNVTLSSTNTAITTFMTPEVPFDTIVMFEITVVNEYDEFDTDEIAIWIKNVNHIPLANAGIDQTVSVGDQVMLNGSLSSDIDGSELSYMWKAPDCVILDDSTNVSPIFTAPRNCDDSRLEFILKVSDGEDFSKGDTVYVFVNDPLSIYPQGGSSNRDFIAELYPNPVNDLAMLKISGMLPDKIKLELINSTGIVIVNNITPVVSDENLRYQIDTKDLDVGLYYLRITSEGYTETIKLLVVR